MKRKGKVFGMDNVNGVTILKWTDQQDKLILSTTYHDQIVDTIRNQRLKAVTKIIIDYNKCKSQVDVFDQCSLSLIPSGGTL